MAAGRRALVGRVAAVRDEQDCPPGHNAHCSERRTSVINAFFDVAGVVITVRSTIRRAWTTYRWDDRPARRPWPHAYLREP
ncbi:hypothetical protein [Streptomyces shenzhenensis]|uniref:hypothetical protein n=1 Tax=Streptomyces shenzhenensis TaxID=943815 RepID=UPI0033EBAEF9